VPLSVWTLRRRDAVAVAAGDRATIPELSRPYPIYCMVFILILLETKQ